MCKLISLISPFVIKVSQSAYKIFIIRNDIYLSLFWQQADNWILGISHNYTLLSLQMRFLSLSAFVIFLVSVLISLALLSATIVFNSLSIVFIDSSTSLVSSLVTGSLNLKSSLNFSRSAFTSAFSQISTMLAISTWKRVTFLVSTLTWC